MAFLTDFWNWRKPKTGQEVKQLYDTKLSGTVGRGKRVAKDLRKTAGITSLKVSTVTDLTETMEILNQGSCRLDDALAKKHAEFDLAIVEFLEADKDYNDYITLQKSKKTNKNLKINNNETR
ncbi:MAG: hypothetical protein JXR05_17215 [Flavobacteriaceae bacterium]